MRDRVVDGRRLLIGIVVLSLFANLPGLASSSLPPPSSNEPQPGDEGAFRRSHRSQGRSRNPRLNPAPFSETSCRRRASRDLEPEGGSRPRDPRVPFRAGRGSRAGDRAESDHATEPAYLKIFLPSTPHNHRTPPA
jgi:hypothetical protein